MKIFLAMVLWAIMMTPASLVFAGEEERRHRLDEMVVSTSRTDVPVGEVPQSVTILSETEIMNSPFERIEDIVRSAPGVYNTRHYGTQTAGARSPIRMRGTGNNRVLVLVDGVPQNDNFNNAIAWVAWGHIPREMVKRIEIVRGPTSALYGSEGLGGVIHIITKDPRPGRETSLRGEAGTSSTYGGHLHHDQKINDFGFLVSGGYEESDGFYMTEDKQPYNIRRYRETGRALGKFTYDIGDHSDLSFSALHYDHETGKGRAFFYDDLQLNQYWLNYSHKAGNIDIKALAYYNEADKTAYQDSSPNFETLTRKEHIPDAYTWGGDLQASFQATDRSQVTVGSSFKQVSWDYFEEYTQSARTGGAEGKQRFISPFANVNVDALEKRLIVNIGARYDWIKTYNGANHDTGGPDPYDNEYDTERSRSFSPKAGITYFLDHKTTLRASGGKGFRAPSLFEYYKVHVRRGGEYFREANPALDPEEIWSYDLGVERFLAEGLIGRLTFYQSFAKDYIDEREQPNGRYILDNIEDVEIHGVEAELHWSARPDLSVFANYTYNESEIKSHEGDPDMEGKNLENDPRHKLHMGIHYMNPRLADITLLHNAYADRYYSDADGNVFTDNYWSVDLALARALTDHASVYLNIENVLDSIDNKEISPGTIFLGGLRYTF